MQPEYDAIWKLLGYLGGFFASLLVAIRLVRRLRPLDTAIAVILLLIVAIGGAYFALQTKRPKAEAPTPPLASAPLDVKSTSPRPPEVKVKQPPKLVASKDEAPPTLFISVRQKRVWSTTRAQKIRLSTALITAFNWLGSPLTTIQTKETNAEWIVSREFLARNPRMPSRVPGGHPMNPLGEHSILLDNGIRIISRSGDVSEAVCATEHFLVLEDAAFKVLFDQVKEGDTVVRGLPASVANEVKASKKNDDGRWWEHLTGRGDAN